MRRAAICGALALLAAAPALAGSWAAGAGRTYAKLTASGLATDELATPAGEEVGIPEFERREAALYVEHGLSDRWTAVLSVPLWRRSSLEGFGAESGLGDVRVGLQVQLAPGATGPWALALRGEVQAPTGDETLGDGLLATGSGAWEGEAVASAGRSFGNGKGYGFLELGNLVRGEGLQDALTYRFQAGYHPARRLTLAWNVHGVEPYGSQDEFFSSPAGLGSGVRYTAFGPTLIADLTPAWALQADAEATAREENLASGVTFRLGLALRR